ETISLDDLPESIVHEAARRIADYAIEFVRFSRLPDDTETGAVAGSGTLVEVDGKRGILTAWHVLEKFPERGKIGLIVPTRSPQLSRWTVEVDRLIRLQIAYGGVDAFGPDLGFLALPRVETADLGARKSFLNLAL